MEVKAQLHEADPMMIVGMRGDRYNGKPLRSTIPTIFTPLPLFAGLIPSPPHATLGPEKFACRALAFIDRAGFAWHVR